jgi:hypothetical protein
MGKARHTTLRLNHERLRNNYAITGWLVLVPGSRLSSQNLSRSIAGRQRKEHAGAQLMVAKAIATRPQHLLLKQRDAVA